MTDPTDRYSIEAFLYREARLADTHAYAEWEALWTDDALYWVPAADDSDPMTHMSVIHDNRRRIATRVRQLETGRRLAQAPPSRLNRIIANIEIVTPVGAVEGGAVEGGAVEGGAGDDVEVWANMIVTEARETGNHAWAGRVAYRLRRSADAPGGWRLAYKKVDLVDRPWTLPTLAFLI